MINLAEWKSSKKAKLTQEIKDLITGRTGYACEHCVRQYDDDICDMCFAKMLVKRFESTII